ncbi:MAG: PP2C family protein-serine/threonine phosphatase [Ruminiclostridium sp.]|nr:PP2C family protein-serine/threonine phosphatase [Ruminiclostridium sp.]
MQKKKKTVTFQIDVPLGIFLLILIIAAMVTTTFYFINKTIGERALKATQIADYTADCMSSYAAIGWLKDFWINNVDDMTLVYGRESANELESYLKERIPGYINAASVTPVQLLSANKETCMVFAELCYTEICMIFDRMQQNYHCSYICSFVVAGDECVYLTSGCDYGELRTNEGGNIYELGARVPFSYGVFPMLDNILAGKENENDDNYIILSLNGENDVCAFSPVHDEYGNTVLVVSTDNDLDDIISMSIQDALRITLITLLLLLLLIVMVHYLLFRNVVQPIKKEETILAEYVEGKDAEKAVSELTGITSNNEIETLAEDFSFMAAELDRYIGEVRMVTTEKERIGAELDMAARIQASQLPATFPAFPERTEFDIYASMDPAKEVGGDFYDFFLVDDDHLALVIADVSGKGVPAALFMMASKILIANYASIGGTPADILSKVNERICERDNDNMFVTVWLGILEISTGKLTTANAGHEYPAIKKAREQFELTKDKHGLFIGAMAGVKYKEYEIQLEKGDTLFVYTDGVPEATNAAGKLFGNERMIDALNSAPNGGLSDLLQIVRSKVDEFVGEAPQFDDLTMLAVRYWGKN